MSFLCDNEQALVGDDAQLNYKDQYLILARLLTEKEVEITVLKKSNKKLQDALDTLSNGTTLQPSSAGVDDEDNEMVMEEGDGGSSSTPVAMRFGSNGGRSSSGTASQLQYTFRSNNDTFVNRMGANDTEVRLFAADQREEMAQYIQSLSQPPAASSSGAAGGSALNDEDILFNALDTVRYLNKECKKLYAENAKLAKKAKRPPGKAVEVLENKLTGQEAMMKVLSKQKDTKWELTLDAVKQTHKEELSKQRVEIKALRIQLQQSQDDVKARNGFDTKERTLLQEIRKLKDERDGLTKALKESRELVQSNFIMNTQQREDLKQARQDLVEFEAMKTEHIGLKRSVDQKTEVKDARAKFDSERRKLQRAGDDRVRRLQGELDTAKEQLERSERMVRQLQESDDEDGRMDD